MILTTALKVVKAMTSYKKLLFIDLETYSEEDIKSSGAFRYIECPKFELLFACYAIDDGEVKTLLGSELDEIKDMLLDDKVLKVAHNCAFERQALSKHFGEYMPPEQWADTMTLSAMNGLPLSLDAVGTVLDLEVKKNKDGTALINYFSKPCKPTKANGGRTRNRAEDNPEKWEKFISYCIDDVRVCRGIFNRLKGYRIPKAEDEVRCLDARINERGVKIDKQLALSAIEIDKSLKGAVLNEMQRLTQLDNPNSVAQLKTWLASQGIEADSLNKETVKELIGKTHNVIVKRVLELRQLLGKTSTKKYQAMLNAVCSDDRVRGLMQYYGASRTGRWAGRLVQVQNLPQNHLDCIDMVRELVKDMDIETLELIYDSIPDVLSQLIRTAFIAKEGHTFLVADYSAIEARVIAYLANEKWRLDVFSSDGKIYEASYAKAFNVPIESVKKGSPERQKGKIMELALGYGGGVNALKAFGADKMGLEEHEMQGLVNAWRQASPTIPNMWQRVEKSAKAALTLKGREVPVSGGAITTCTYLADDDALRCKLPSGRVLTYWNARIGENGIEFMGQNQTTKKWEKTQTWGGRLVENIVQAFARDCLALAMKRLEANGYEIVFSVHDEVIVEAPIGSRWEDIAEIMAEPIEWAPGLKLPADGYETPFYMKD